jgi:hypothetical protein
MTAGHTPDARNHDLNHPRVAARAPAHTVAYWLAFRHRGTAEAEVSAARNP